MVVHVLVPIKGPPFERGPTISSCDEIPRCGNEGCCRGTWAAPPTSCNITLWFLFLLVWPRGVALHVRGALGLWTVCFVYRFHFRDCVHVSMCPLHSSCTQGHNDSCDHIITTHQPSHAFRLFVHPRFCSFLVLFTPLSIHPPDPTWTYLKRTHLGHVSNALEYQRTDTTVFIYVRWLPSMYLKSFQVLFLFSLL